VDTQSWQKINAGPVGEQTPVPQFTDTHVSNSAHSPFLHYSPSRSINFSEISKNV